MAKLSRMQFIRSYVQYKQYTTESKFRAQLSAEKKDPVVHKKAPNWTNSIELLTL